MILFSTVPASMEHRDNATMRQPPGGSHQVFGLILQAATTGLMTGRAGATLLDPAVRPSHPHGQAEQGERTPTVHIGIQADIHSVHRRSLGSSELGMRSFVGSESDPELVSGHPQGYEYRSPGDTALTGSLAAETILTQGSASFPASTLARSGAGKDGDGAVAALHPNGRYPISERHTERFQDENASPVRAASDSVSETDGSSHQLGAASISKAGESQHSGRSGANYRDAHANWVEEASLEDVRRITSARSSMMVSHAPADVVGAHTTGQGATSTVEDGVRSSSNSPTPSSHLRDTAGQIERQGTRRATRTPLESAPSGTMRRGDNLSGEMLNQNTSFLNQERGQVRSVLPPLMSEYSVHLLDSFRHPVDVSGGQNSSNIRLGPPGLHLNPTDVRTGHGPLLFDANGIDRMVADQRLEPLFRAELVRGAESTVTAESGGFDRSPRNAATRSGVEDLGHESSTEINTPGTQRDVRRVHEISGNDRADVLRNATRERLVRVPHVLGDARVDSRERTTFNSGSLEQASEAFDRVDQRGRRGRSASEVHTVSNDKHERVTEGVAVGIDSRTTDPGSRRGIRSSNAVRSGIGREQLDTPKRLASGTATIRIEDDAGKTAHIRVTVRGEQVNTRIVHEDRHLVETLTAKSGELRDALSQRGLSDAGISVRATRNGSELGMAHSPTRGVTAEVADGVTSQSEERRHEGRQERRDDGEFNQRGEQWQGHSKRRNPSRDESPPDPQ